MARKPRLFVPHGVYHIYSRVGRGERVFDCAEEAEHWVSTVREVAQLHELTILAWCLMANHYHLVLRSGIQPIWRPMAKIQRRVSRFHNVRLGVQGHLWQSRYKARLVLDNIYFDQVVAYVHLNPIAAGVVEDPADYRWSGHRELIGKAGHELVNVHEALLTFGTRLRSCRAAYLTRLRHIQEEKWFRQGVRCLPWWRPVADDEQTLEETHAPEDAALFDGTHLALQEVDRPGLPELQKWFEDALPPSRGRLAARTQSRHDCYFRRLFAFLAVAELGHTCCEVAKLLQRDPSTVSRWLGEGLRLRHVEPSFQDDLNRLLTRLGAEILQE